MSQSDAARPRVKICGVTTETDRDAAVAAGADAVGLIAGVTVDTPREVGLDRAAALARGVPPLVSSVLVTMAPDADAVRERVEGVRPDVVQIHGLGPAELDGLDDLPAAVVAAVDAEDADLAAYESAVDALLVDSIDEEGGGGTGETVDWERTRERIASLSVPVILAGGLTPHNVAEAVRTVDPFGVDVATGVEREGGVKDHDAVERFVANAMDTSGGRADPPEVDGR